MVGHSHIVDDGSHIMVVRKNAAVCCHHDSTLDEFWIYTLCCILCCTHEPPRSATQPDQLTLLLCPACGACRNYPDYIGTYQSEASAGTGDGVGAARWAFHGYNCIDPWSPDGYNCVRGWGSGTCGSALKFMCEIPQRAFPCYPPPSPPPPPPNPPSPPRPPQPPVCELLLLLLSLHRRAVHGLTAASCVAFQ